MLQSSSILLLALGVLAGCAPAVVQPTPVVKTYIGPPKPATELSIVRSSSDPAEFVASFAEYSEGSLLVGAIKVGQAATGYPSELHMSPGKYVLMIRCGGRNSFAFPQLPLSVVAGTTYEISCMRTGVNDRMIRAYVSKTYTAHSGV